MARKTFDVETLKRRVNARLDSPMSSPEGRWELARVLEDVLHQTDNYKGFGYLESEYAAEPPYAPGTTHLRPGYDDTRRSYR
jgi:hypothetical protein